MASTNVVVARIMAVGLAVGLVLGASSCGRKTVAKKKSDPVVMIDPVPPPPPLPPPPPPPPQAEPPPEEKEQEMVEQEPVVEATPDEPGPEEPPAELGTGLTGDGPNGFGLSGRGDGNGGGGNGKGRKGGGPFDRYAALLQNTLGSELRRNSKTRASTFDVQVSLRIDAEGRITSIKPKSSTGDPSLDQSLRNDFIGVRFSEPPPADMPMPIHTRLTGRKR
ncbi:TonB C-terminal domain-containing protein [Haloferula sp. BvORR071]|uniref:energy transducer TonB family protein n=1 Tax=Haloferula sp. BvORR071 TaxID=1396141 RepID=UPI00224100D0|nr:TonB C-terminal domain-containing protein [Haloferula sp. BvORR071]